MRRLLLIAALLAVLALGLVPIIASGQASAPRLDACTGTVIPPGTPTTDGFDITKPFPGCADPRPGSFGVNTSGVVEWHYCRNPETGRYYPQFQVITRNDLTNIEMVREALSAGWPNIGAADRYRMAQKYAAMVKPLGHPENAAVWCPFRERMTAGIPAASAPTPWVVAKNGVLTTRPTYPVVSGRRSTRSNGSVPVGANCEAAGAIVEGPLTFGYPDGGPPNSVALCVRR